MARRRTDAANTEARLVPWDEKLTTMSPSPAAEVKMTQTARLTDGEQAATQSYPKITLNRNVAFKNRDKVSKLFWS